MKNFEHRFRVPFHQLDPAGIMFFAHLFTHAHDAYSEFMSTLGYPLKELLENGIYLIPLVHAEADYLHPLRLDEEITVTIEIASLGNSALHFSYKFHRDDELCATAATSHIFLDRQSNTPAPIPQALRQLLTY